MQACEHKLELLSRESLSQRPNLYFNWLQVDVIKGARGPDLGMIKIEFYVVCDRGELQVSDAFYLMKILFVA